MGNQKVVTFADLGERLDRILNECEMLPAFRQVSERPRYRELALPLFRRLLALSPGFSFRPLAMRLYRLRLLTVPRAVRHQPGVRQQSARRSRRPARVLHFPLKSA